MAKLDPLLNHVHLNLTLLLVTVVVHLLLLQINNFPTVDSQSQSLNQKSFSRRQIINNCNECVYGPICLRMDLPDLSDYDISKCNKNDQAINFTRDDCPEVPFMSVVKLNRNRFRVWLIGYGYGWVGLAFSNNEEYIMRAGALGIACFHHHRKDILQGSGIENDIRVVFIQDRGSPTDIKPHLFSNKSLEEHGIYNPFVRLSRDGFLMCQFDLNSTLRLFRTTNNNNTTDDDEKDDFDSFEIAKHEFKIGIAYHPDKGIVDGYLQQAHAQRGSSFHKLDFFNVLHIGQFINTRAGADSIEGNSYRKNDGVTSLRICRSFLRDTYWKFLFMSQLLFLSDTIW